MTDASTPAVGAPVAGGLTPERLQGPVRALLADPAAVVLTHHARSIYAALMPSTAGVYRVTGAARRGDGTRVEWSLVLKVVRSPAGLAADAVGHTREVLAYGSGLLAALSASATAAPAPGGGTRVVVSVIVPPGPDGARFPTRLTVSTGPWGTLTVYGTTTGTAGTPMTVQFLLGVP